MRPAWALQGPCTHGSRWVLPSLAAGRDEEAGRGRSAAPPAAGDASMLVKLPADLAWSSLACQVPAASAPCFWLQPSGGVLRDGNSAFRGFCVLHAYCTPQMVKLVAHAATEAEHKGYYTSIFYAG